MHHPSTQERPHHPHPTASGVAVQIRPRRIAPGAIGAFSAPATRGTSTGSTPDTARAGYSPAQQRILDLLGRQSGDAEAIEPAHIASVQARMDAHLDRVAAQIPAGMSLWVGKSALTTFERCPGAWQADVESPFRWSVPSVRGTVAHKAIELSLNWRGEAEPARMVDAAIEHMVDHGGSAGTYLRTLTTVELAELRCASVELVTSFEECFPPLRSRWRPVLEGRLRAEFGQGKVVLAGKPDLTLGRATAGGKVIIDFKSGSRSPAHNEDLRFYALIDALRLGVAPRRTATVYLDSGRPSAERITASTLDATADRVLAIVEAMVDTRWGTVPTRLRSGPQCSWCPARSSCVAGLARAESERADPQRASL